MKCSSCDNNEVILGCDICAECEHFRQKELEQSENKVKTKIKCPHKKTVAINEEGHAGVYCVNCGEQLEKEC